MPGLGLKEKIIVPFDRRELLHHSPDKWEQFTFEPFYPRLESATLTYLEGFLANVFEYVELECGVVADLTRSTARRIGHLSKRSDQIHEEFEPIVSHESLSDDNTAEKLRKGSDVDVKIRVSNNEELPFKPLFGETVRENFEFILFSLAKQMAEEQLGEDRSRIITGTNRSGQEYLAWPINGNLLMKVTKGSIPDMVNRSNRRYHCTAEILQDAYLKEDEPTGHPLAEFDMGYDPVDVSEDVVDTRSGSTVSEIMRMRVRLRGREGKLYGYKSDIDEVKERVKQPDRAANFGGLLINNTDIAGYFERTLRELRAEGLLLDPSRFTMEELLRAAADPELWRARRILAEQIQSNGYYWFDKQIKNPDGLVLEAKLKSELMVIGETDPWWAIMSMANTGLLQPIPYFRGRANDGAIPLDVAVYHEWLTSDAMNTTYIPDPYRNDPRSKVPLPPFMRTMAQVMKERELYLRGWEWNTDNGKRPSSGLVLWDRAIENQPSLPQGTRLTEEVFLKFLLYYFYLQKGPLKTFYQRPDIYLNYGQEEIRFRSYRNFFDFIVAKISENLPEVAHPYDVVTRRSLDRFRAAIEVLKANIDRHQATFNITTLGLNHEADLLEKLFKSGLITRTGGDRAIFTSPRIVASIWEAQDKGELKNRAFANIVGQLEERYNSLVKDKDPRVGEFNNNLARAGKKRKDHFRRAALDILRDEDFPSPAAVFYYEIPSQILDLYIG